MRNPLAALDARLGIPPPVPGAPGDPGLFGPGSMVWTVGRERVLLLAGPAALLMQLAHPLVAAAVTRHSDFRSDPIRRLRGTLQAVLAIGYGDRTQAEAAAASVRSLHARVSGSLPVTVGPFAAGTPYQASDPALALWVHATLVTTALEAFARFVRPLARADMERYWEESKRFAALFGVTRSVLPDSYDDFESYRRTAEASLVVGDDARMLAFRVLRPPLPRALRPGAFLVPLFTAGLLPPTLRRDYGLPWDRRRRRAFAAWAGVVRATVGLWPPSVRFWPHYRLALARAAPDAPEERTRLEGLDADPP